MEESDFSIQKEIESLKGSAQEDASTGYVQNKESPFKQFLIGDAPTINSSISQNDLQFWINQANTNAQLAYQQSLINQQLTQSLINALVKKSDSKAEQSIPWKFLGVIAICSLIVYVVFNLTQKSSNKLRKNPIKKQYPIEQENDT